MGLQVQVGIILIYFWPFSVFKGSHYGAGPHDFFVFGLMFDPKLSHHRGLVVSQWSLYVSERALKFGLLKKLDHTPLCLVHFF